MRTLALALLLAFAALAGCAAAPSPPTRQEQTVDGLSIALEAVDNARINTAQEFIISLSDAGGQPVDGASVYLDLTMTQMPMGTNRPVASPLGGGRYRAEAAYTMTGPWVVTVFADVEGVERSAVFDLTVVE